MTLEEVVDMLVYMFFGAVLFVSVMIGYDLYSARQQQCTGFNPWQEYTVTFKDFKITSFCKPTEEVNYESQQREGYSLIFE